MTLTVTPGVVDATWADITAAATLVPKLTVTFAVDDLLVVMVSSDNAGLNGAVPCITTMTGTGFGSIVKQQNAVFDPLNAQNGAELAIFTAVCTSSRVTTDTVTINFNPSPSSKCCLIWKIAGSGGDLPAVGSSGVGTGANTGTPTVTTASVPVGGVAIGMISLEGRVATHPVTGDADTTNGSWSTQLGTSAESGADASSMLIASQNKVQTTTPSTQTYNPTFTAADCIPGWITIVAGVNGTATPAAIDLSAVTPAPTATGDSNTTPAAVALAAVVPAPTASGDSDTAPAAVALSAVTPAPTATGGSGGDGEATPAAIALAAVTPAPTASGDANTTPTAVALAAVTPAPTATGDNAVDGTATPAAIALTVVVPAPTVSGGTATPAAIALAVVVPAPTASGTVGAVLAATWGPMTGVIVADVSNRIEAVLTASW